MSNRAKTILLFLGDLICLITALLITITIRHQNYDFASFLQAHIKLFTFVFPFWFVVFFIEGMYTLKTFNPAVVSISLLRASALNLAASFVIIYLLPASISNLTPKTNLLIITIISTGLLFAWKKWFFGFFSDSKRNRGVLLVGSKETTQLVADEITLKPYLGYKVISIMDTKQAINSTLPDGVEVIAVERTAAKDHILLQQIFGLLGTVDVIDLATFAEKISGKIPLTSIDESWFIEYCGHQESRSYDVFKSLLDRTVALLMMIGLIPVAMIIVPLFLIFQGRPIFFKQVRTGLANKPFTLYKLRSMVVDAEKTGAQWSKPGDARITKFGKFLRKTRLDELPQLINIFRGEMSLVGPRPERPEIIKGQLEERIPFYKMRHLVKPGVTGWAQVTFRYGYSAEDSLEKLQYDLYYVKNRTLWLDILVIIKTIKTIITGAGQ